MSSSSFSFQDDDDVRSSLLLREIPGGYGFPFFGPIKDRLDYFYNQGRDEFFRARMLKYQSTVFRVNMPPGPFMASNPNVVVLLDALTFPVLFDTTRVEKRDVLDGTYMPSTAFTGGYRALAYLDPSEPNHAALKRIFMSELAARHLHVIPLFRSCLTELFAELENGVSSRKGTANFNAISDSASFDFVFKLFTGKYPSDTKVGSGGSGFVTKWLFLQLAPLATLGLSWLPNLLEDLLLHTFPLPSLLTKSGYKKLYDAFYASGTSILDQAERVGIRRDEACHNLVFLAGFNAYGGMKALFPALIKWVGSAGEKLHRRLAAEIRSVVGAEGGVSVAALEKMALTKSVVYEALRIEPPVPFQYGKAKEDMVIRSHDAAFQVRKGEMMFGYQPFATKDPKVFEDPEDFVADRFVGAGERLLKYVYWSNGRESEDPTADNKQCPAKDLVVLLSRVMLVEFFLRYDTFEIEYATLLLGASVTFKSITKAATSQVLINK